MTKDKLLEKAHTLIAECSKDYNHPYFTDRHGVGPNLKAWLEAYDKAYEPQSDVLRRTNADYASGMAEAVTNMFNADDAQS